MVRIQIGVSKATSSETANARMLPYERRVKRLEDYYENRDGRYGYCFCGCGEKTGITKHTNVQRGSFEGEPAAFLTGHHMRVQPAKSKVLSDEQIERIRYLWANSSLTSKEIGVVVGTTIRDSFLRAVAWNQALYDPDYTPPSYERVHGLRSRRKKGACVICGKEFTMPLTGRQRLCGNEECRRERRRQIIKERAPLSEETRRRMSLKAKERHASGRYPKNRRGQYGEERDTPLQTRMKSKMPSQRPHYVSEMNWEALALHVNDLMTFPEMAKRFGGSYMRYSHRARKAADAIEEHGQDT